jgi:L-rhamnonate dehydratase
MKRRSFFGGAAAAAAALSSIPLFSEEVQAQAKSANLRVTGMELFRVTGDAKKYDAYLEEEYPKGGMVRPAPNPQRPQGAPTATYLRMTTDGGITGLYGPHNDDVVQEVQLMRNMVGQDPLAIQAVFDSMYSGNNQYTGLYMFGMSAITNVLWDIKGKFCNLPVYRLLGGNRKTIKCYATTIGMPINTLDVVAEGAARVKAAGFTGQKWFPTLGPTDGAAGLEFNVNMVRTLRETCGDYYDIMFDGLLHWDLPYVEALCKRVEQYHPRWVEEPMQAYSQVDPLARLRQVTSIPIATGEHLYNRWQFNELIKANAIDILEPDPEWAGGITEIMKICALAEVNGLEVSPHHMKQTALAHVVASQNVTTCPWAEYRHSMYMGTKYFEKDPIVHDGKSQLVLPDRPGLGIELDEAKIVKTETVWKTAPQTTSSGSGGSGGTGAAAGASGARQGTTGGTGAAGGTGGTGGAR